MPLQYNDISVDFSYDFCRLLGIGFEQIIFVDDFIELCNKYINHEHEFDWKGFTYYSDYLCCNIVYVIKKINSIKLLNYFLSINPSLEYILDVYMYYKESNISRIYIEIEKYLSNLSIDISDFNIIHYIITKYSDYDSIDISLFIKWVIDTVKPDFEQCIDLIKSCSDDGVKNHIKNNTEFMEYFHKLLLFEMKDIK